MNEKLIIIKDDYDNIKDDFKSLIVEDRCLFIKRVLEDIENKKDIIYSLYKSKSDIKSELNYSLFNIKIIYKLKYRLNISSEEALALYALYQEKDGEIELDTIINEYKNGYVIKTYDLQKRSLIWYYNEELEASFVCYIDTLEIIDENDKIKNLLGKEN